MTGTVRAAERALPLAIVLLIGVMLIHSWAWSRRVPRCR